MIKYENKKYLTTNEASVYLGKNVSSFRQFINRNPLPRRKLGGRLYFPLEDLNGWFARKAHLEHFEQSRLSYEEVYTLEQIQDILLTTKSHIYSLINKHSVTRYKDNTGRTLFNKSQIDAVLDKSLKEVDDL